MILCFHQRGSRIMKCIYHNDMDGRCAGALIAHFVGHHNPDDFIEVSYKEFPIDHISKFETVYIVDYSFTPTTAHYLKKLIEDMQCYVIWIDHHTSSINLADNPEFTWVKCIPGVRDEHLSGAGLVWAYFTSQNYSDPEQLPLFVQLVDDYDRWVYRLGDTTNYFKLGLETRKFDALDYVWKELRTSPESIHNIIGVGRIIKQYIDKDNAVYLNSYGYESIIDDTPCYVVNKRTNSWIFGDKINEYPIVAIWVFDGVRYQYSLYSVDESVNCAEIAERYGGGGHKGAAGFQSDELLLHMV